MTTTPFKHSPLDPADPRAIRILDLLPSPTLKGPIRCELHHSSLDAGVRYEAVSYTWGQPEPGYTVLVNGPYTLDITPNCHEALMSLRQRFRHRRLWIDAICIDQRENDMSKRDRDRQIKIMGAIFHEAKKVLAWLGPAEPSTARTIARLKLIVKMDTKYLTFGSSALSSLERHVTNRMIGDTSIFTPPPRYQAFTSMMSSPWWQRVWTLQEQALSTQCVAHHGRHSIPLYISTGFKLRERLWLSSYAQTYYKYFARDVVQRSCVYLYKAFQQDSSDQNLLNYYRNMIVWQLLQVAFLLEAKNPIDKIYGLYSILTAYCQLPLSAPDYNKTAEDVYEETVWAWIQSRDDLNILKLAARPGHVHNLPSWVPAWHQQHPGVIRNVQPLLGEVPTQNPHGPFNWSVPLDALIYNTGTYPCGESEGSVSFARILTPGRLIISHARSMGRVSHAIGPVTSHSPEWYRGSIECLYVHLDWCKLFREVFYRATEREEALREMFRSLIFPGIYRTPSRDDANLEGFESFRAWFDFLIHLREASEMIGTEQSHGPGVDLYFDVCVTNDEEEATNLLQSRYSGDIQERENLTELARHIRSTKEEMVYVRNHRLCILDNDNMIAVTDYWCQEGDQVFVFPGTDSPFVLRKQPDGECYRLVGPTLVDRLLRVGYQEWRSEGHDLQDIVLI